MEDKALGFIGAGRVVKILLGGFRRAGKLPSKIIVSDTSEAILQKLKEDFPEIEVVSNGNHQTAKQDIIFVALHPPIMGSILADIRSDLKPTSSLSLLRQSLPSARSRTSLADFSGSCG
jgi:pyrroline-5-carboxylate reductase